MVASQTKLNTRCDRERLTSVTGDCSIFVIPLAGRPHRTSSPGLAQCLRLFLAINHPVSSKEALCMAESAFIAPN